MRLFGGRTSRRSGRTPLLLYNEDMRPRSRYIIKFYPRYTCFQPLGIRHFGEVVEISLVEAETLRLKHLKELDQLEAAERMGVSQSTFQRILASAHKKITYALIHGKTIQIID